MAGFTVSINGAVLLTVDGGAPFFSSGIDANDWMISGTNEITVDLFWPEGVKFSPGSSARFRLLANNSAVKDFQWPLPNAADALDTEPHTFRDTFRANGFPRVQLEKAERVISSAGVLPRSDQDAITALAEELRQAFSARDAGAVNALFRVKYADLALARFTAAGSLRNAFAAEYRALMDKEGYAVRPFSGRYSFFAVAEGRAVRLIQGRIGFPEPALVITCREGGRTVRYDLDLYFAKIDGVWVIIR
jgi:hypothetical protein